MNLRKMHAVFVILSILSTRGFSGITRVICKAEDADIKICVEEPNGSGFIPLKMGESKQKLREVKAYLEYSNENFILDYELMKLTDLKDQKTFTLICAEATPGSCGSGF